MENPLSKVALDHWYQVLMVAGLAVFLVNGAGVLKAYPTGPVALLSAGGFFFGMGEWVNHPRHTAFLPATAHRPAGVVISHPRSTCRAGLMLDCIGLGLIGAGVYRLLAGLP